MSIEKECADRLRHTYTKHSGFNLKAGHAHELVAAYFGYGSAIALRAEASYPIKSVEEASVLVPDLALMDSRRAKLKQLPSDLQSTDELARDVSAFLMEKGYFAGKVWHNRDVSEEIYIHVMDDAVIIEDALLGEMALTNAFFDDLIHIDEVTIETSDDTLTATLSGSLDGKQDLDRPFRGDKIGFKSIMTMYRVAGRIAYMEPNFETIGEVDDSAYYD